MERKLYKQLWRTRFEKMLTLEKEGLATYQELLKDCAKKENLKQHPVIQINLEQVAEDEKRHIKLVEELLAILDRQPD